MYIIINDRDNPPRFYAGNGYNEGATSNPDEAVKFKSIKAVHPHMQGKAVLYAAGWRIVPVVEKKEG